MHDGAARLRATTPALPSVSRRRWGARIPEYLLEFVVVFMAAYPIPSDNAIFIPANSTIIPADTNGIDGVSWVNLLEMQRWMIGIDSEKLVCFDGLLLYP